MNINELKNMITDMKVVAETNPDGTQKEFKKREYLPFFSPSKMFVGRDTVIVRVIPNEKDFFYAFKKHMVSMGPGNFKQIICTHTIDESGNELDKKCPLCEFVENNKTDLDSEIVNSLSARDVYIMFIYNPYAKEVQRFETQVRGMIDISTALADLMDKNPTFDANKEGFDIVFRMDGKYPKCVEAMIPKTPLEKVWVECENKHLIIDEDFNIKSFMSEIMPFPLHSSKKYINTTTQLIVAGTCPGFDASLYLFDESETVKPTTYVPSRDDSVHQTLDEIFDPIVDTEEITAPEVETKVETTTEETSDEDADIADIRNFLNSRKR